MTRIFAFLILAVTASIADLTSFNVCNDKTCYIQKLECSRFEWLNGLNGERFLRVYRPDGTAVDISGHSLKIDIAMTKSSKKKHK